MPVKDMTIPFHYPRRSGEAITEARRPGFGQSGAAFHPRPESLQQHRDELRLAARRRKCPDCGDDPALPGRCGVCDDCGGYSSDNCDNCQGTGSPICCRCEGTGKITQEDYDDGWQ